MISLIKQLMLGKCIKNWILNFTNSIDSSKLKFGQNINLSMPDHILLHAMNLLYIGNSYLGKSVFSTSQYSGVVFTPTLHNSHTSPRPKS